MNLSCPIPLTNYPRVLLAHGGGGTLMRGLIDVMFSAAFGDLGLQTDTDAALFPPTEGGLALTTDSFVVHPLFFPGGDIGRLAIHGTVNDLATVGAVNGRLTCSFILEEGLPMEDLWRVVRSMAEAAREAGVAIVTGDTKVVDRGHGHGIYINTAGVGEVRHGLDLSPKSIRAGDVMVVNGDIGRHGVAIVAQREGLDFETVIETDSAPLNGLVAAWLAAGIRVRCLRDITRGGLAAVLHELAGAGGLAYHLVEAQVPVREDVMSVCELLGFDPLHIACEGRMLAVVAAEDADRAVTVAQTEAVGEGATVIGTVIERDVVPVTMRSRSGASRVVSMLSGEPLPRIC